MCICGDTYNAHQRFILNIWFSSMNKCNKCTQKQSYEVLLLLTVLVLKIHSLIIC